MKKISFLVFLVIVLLSFSSSSLFAAIESEESLFFGYTSGASMKGAQHIKGLDVCFCVCENKNPKLKLKSVKQKLGWRMSLCGEVERKNDELKNSKIEYNSFKFIMSSEFVINEKFSFNIKGLYGFGVYSHNEFTKSKEEYLATSVIAEGEIFVGVMSFLTKRFGLGVDLGYRFSKDINKNRENAEKFDSSGLIAMLNFHTTLF